MVASSAAFQADRPVVRPSAASPLGAPSGQTARDRPDLYYMRASGLAQARLQLAVLSGNRRRALEQIDRLVAIDHQFERMACGEPLLQLSDLSYDLADQRLAIATEKLALTSGIDLPRLEPAFGAGMTSAVAPVEEVEIIEDDRLNSGVLHAALWALAFLALCFGATAAAMFLL